MTTTTEFVLSTISEGGYRYLFHSSSYLPVNKPFDSALLTVLSDSLDKRFNNRQSYISRFLIQIEYESVVSSRFDRV